ncbi:MAG: hypothetical protein V1728_01895 [Candidatus Micrarchaeota archaeon]
MDASVISLIPVPGAKTVRVPGQMECLKGQRIVLGGGKEAVFGIVGASHIFDHYKDVSPKTASFSMASHTDHVELRLSLVEGKAVPYVRVVMNFEAARQENAWPQANPGIGEYAEYIFFLTNESGRPVESHLIIRYESLTAAPAIRESSAELQVFHVFGLPNAGSGPFGTRTLDPELVKLL